MTHKNILLVSVVLLFSACSTMKPTELPPEDLQQMINTENVLESGDKVKLVTNDGKVHEFRVTKVDTDAGVITGKNKTVPINDVVAMETKEFSGGKTALLAAGTYGALALLVLALAPVLIL